MRGRQEPALRPVVVIGAARSGTRLLRDVLGEASGAGTVPYDVGYVWRHGNQSHPDDRLPAEGATPAVRRFVRGFLARYADEKGRLVEKTVGNTLRVPFVARVLPEAAFVHLVRDGVDVTLSARRQWSAPLDLGYLRRKAGHFPLRLVPSYGRRFVVGAVADRVSPRASARTWGPRYPGIDADLAAGDLLAVCARQWRTCVETARRDLARVAQPVVEVRYEELVASPETTIRRVAAGAGLAMSDAGVRRATALVTGPPRTRERPGEPMRTTLRRELAPCLEELGYGLP